MDCVFCKIVNKEIPANIVYEDENYMAFHDIAPLAPVHIIIIPKKHIESFHLVYIQQDRDLIKGTLDIAWEIIKEHEIKGCQLHINSGADHGQVVGHFHLHLLSKAKRGEMWN